MVRTYDKEDQKFKKNIEEIPQRSKREAERDDKIHNEPHIKTK